MRVPPGAGAGRGRSREPAVVEDEQGSVRGTVELDAKHGLHVRLVPRRLEDARRVPHADLAARGALLPAELEGAAGARLDDGVGEEPAADRVGLCKGRPYLLRRRVVAALVPEAGTLALRTHVAEPDDPA